MIVYRTTLKCICRQYDNNRGKSAVEGRIGAGKTLQEARLMTKEKIVALGGDIVNLTTSGFTGTTAFVNVTNYWLGSPDEGNSLNEWYVNGEYSAMYGGNYIFNDFTFGLRPVLVVLKSNI